MTGPQTYRRKPTPVEAWQVTAENLEEVAGWLHGHGYEIQVDRPPRLTRTYVTVTKDGDFQAEVTLDQWLVRYPAHILGCGAAQFARDFEPATPDPLAVQRTLMQNMLNELGICDDCGRRCDQGPHDDPVASGTCKECGEAIDCISACCWTGPSAIWLHAEPAADDHEAQPTEEDERRANESATAEGGDHHDPLTTLRQSRHAPDPLACLLAGDEQAARDALAGMDADGLEQLVDAATRLTQLASWTWPGHRPTTTTSSEETTQ